MKIFVYTVIAIVGIAIIAGFFVVGSPFEERLRRFDERRVSDLQSLQWEIVNYWQRKEKIPASLVELNDDIRGYRIPRDPETGAEYEYAVRGDVTFSLCGTFSRAAKEGGPGFDYAPIAKPAGPDGINAATWEHSEGRVCFERTIDKQLYSPYTKEQVR